MTYCFRALVLRFPSGKRADFAWLCQRVRLTVLNKRWLQLTVLNKRWLQVDTH